MWYSYTPIFGRFLILGIYSYFAFYYEFEYLISLANLTKKKKNFRSEFISFFTVFMISPRFLHKVFINK